MYKKVKKAISFITFLSLASLYSSNFYAIDISNIQAKSAILIDKDTQNILYEYNSDEPLPPASLTKIMSLILIFENIENGYLKEDDILTCSAYANSINGSQIWLDEGEQMSVKDLLKAVIIASANDATTVFAEKIAGNEQNFVKMMNAKAKQLNLQHTHFSNCTGLDEDGHLTSAKDIAIMSTELLKHEKILEYTKIWMDQLRDGKTELVNTNKLIRFYPGATGLKTGTTDNAGYCLSASAQRNNLSLIGVIMGANSSDDRFSSAKSILNYGFDNFISIQLDDIQKKLNNLKIERGTEDYVGLYACPPNNILVEKSERDNITQKINIPNKIEAPVNKGQTVGFVEAFIHDKKIYKYPIKASQSIDKINFYSAMKKILINLITI